MTKAELLKALQIAYDLLEVAVKRPLRRVELAEVQSRLSEYIEELGNEPTENLP